jgi:RHS repeat-associated protein
MVAIIDTEANLIERVSCDATSGGGNARHHRMADLTGNGAVNVSDQTALFDAWGNYGVGDLNRDGVVNTTDLNILFNAWGAALPAGRLSLTDNVVGYAGYVFNAEISGGLYTVRYRHYDPALGRWLERDPLGYVDGMNLYGYVANSPIITIDPYGQFGIIGGIVGGVVGAVTGAGIALITGGDVVAGAVGGAVAGAIIGSGAVIVAGAATGIGGLIVGGAAVGATGGIVGNTVEQIIRNVREGMDVVDAIAAISTAEQIYATMGGAAAGVLGAAIQHLLKHLHKLSAADLKKLAEMIESASEVLQKMGIDPVDAQKQITRRMGEIGRHHATQNRVIEAVEVVGTATVSESGRTVKQQEKACP